MKHNCPICNKAGLPNYTKSEVVCPQCNSDLKAFLLLDSIATTKIARFGMYALIGLSFLVIFFLACSLNQLLIKEKFLLQTLF
jgi:hypothetical protein